MTQLTLKHKRLSPSVSVALIKIKDKKKKWWRHRYGIKARMSVKQEFKDYTFSKFDSIEKFAEFIENMEKPKGYVII